MHYVDEAHWILPWLILVIGLYSIARFTQGYINGVDFTPTDQRLVAIFSGLLDLQAALGLTFFLVTGLEGIGFPANRIMHGSVMLIAAIVPHFSARWIGVEDKARFIDNFFVILASFLLMLVGLSLI